VQKNAESQKIIAFEGGFNRLFHNIDIDRGIGAAGIVVQDCLLCSGQLLRCNVSNRVELFPRNIMHPSSYPHATFSTGPRSPSRGAGFI